MPRRLLLTGPVQGREDYADAARAAGWDVVEHPLIEVRCLDLDPDLLSVFPPHWVAITSSNALPALTALRASFEGVPFACVGESTAGRLRQLGFEVALGPARDAAELAERLVAAVDPDRRPGTRVLWPRGSLAVELGERAQKAGFRVVDAVVYETRPSPSNEPLPRADAVFLASPSAVRRYMELVRLVDDDAPVGIAIGATTLRAMSQRAGDRFGKLVQLEAPAPAHLGACLVELSTPDLDYGA